MGNNMVPHLCLGQHAQLCALVGFLHACMCMYICAILLMLQRLLIHIFQDVASLVYKSSTFLQHKYCGAILHLSMVIMHT